MKFGILSHFFFTSSTTDTIFHSLWYTQHNYSVATMSKTPQNTFVLSRSLSSCPFAPCFRAFNNALILWSNMLHVHIHEYTLFTNTHTYLEVQLKPKTFYMLIMMLLQIRCVQRKAATTTKMYFRCFQKEWNTGQIMELSLSLLFVPCSLSTNARTNKISLLFFHITRKHF